MCIIDEIILSYITEISIEHSPQTAPAYVQIIADVYEVTGYWNLKTTSRGANESHFSANFSTQLRRVISSAQLQIPMDSF